MANKVIVNGLNIGYLPPTTSDEILYVGGGNLTVKDKIDSIEASVPEIVDNLTTDDSTKVLSARQGKILNDNMKAYPLTFTTVENNLADWISIAAHKVGPLYVARIEFVNKAFGSTADWVKVGNISNWAASAMACTNLISQSYRYEISWRIDANGDVYLYGLGIQNTDRVRGCIYCI